MVSIYAIKPAFQAILRPVLHRLARLGVTPNQITIAAILLSLLGGLTIWYSKAHPALLLTISPLLLVRMALNALDGMLAREYNQASPAGEIFNEVGDILSDAALYLPLIGLFKSLPAILLLTTFIALAGLTEFCGILAKAMTGVRRYDGPFGKSDRACAISILTLSLYFWPVVVHQASLVILLGLNALLILSCVNRLRFILITQKGMNHE